MTKPYRHIAVLAVMLYGALANGQEYCHIAVGSRAGATNFHLSSDMARKKLAPIGMFDASFTYFWNREFRVDMGIRTGVNVGVTLGNHKYEYHDAFTNYDYYGHQMDYQVDGVIKQQPYRVQLEVPMLFAYRNHGFNFAVGAKLVLPNLTNSVVMDLSDVVIKTWYEDYHVEVPNELIIGKLGKDVSLQSKNDKLQVHAVGSMEVGYEWVINHRGHIPSLDQYIGVMAYADLGIYNSGKNDGFKAIESERLINVPPIVDPHNPVPTVTVGSVARNSKAPYYDFGIRCYYAFSLLNRRSNNMHIRNMW